MRPLGPAMLVSRPKEACLNIRGVVFDYGGVLARSPVPDDFEPVASEIGLTWEIYKDGFSRYRLDYDSDRVTCAEMYRKIVADHGLSMTEGQCERLCKADDESWLHPMAETLEWMHELKSDGYRIGILTNMATSFFDRCVRHVFAEHIALSDALVVSGKEGVSKPDPRIYRLMEERLNLDSREILFLDDNARNVAGAQSVGWQAVRFESVETLRQQGKIVHCMIMPR